MTASGAGPRWIKGLLPADTLVAHKTGTSHTVGGLTRATNDVGIVRLPDGWHLAVAVFVADSKADEATREAVIARIARAAWDRWIGEDLGHEPQQHASLTGRWEQVGPLVTPRRMPGVVGSAP
jgi:hypothetical protein